MGGRRAKRLILVMASLLVGVVLAELGVRVWMEKRQTEQLEAWRLLSTEHAQSLRRPATLAAMIQVSSNRNRVYELLPNITLTYQQREVVTNRWGLRNPDFNKEKPADTIRVLGLGDSRMFGYGVLEPECYLRQLEGLLNAQGGARKYEVINTGVPGYNTVMEVATLEDLGLELQPDLVLLEIVGNDLSLPNFLCRSRDYWDLSRSYLWEILRPAPPEPVKSRRKKGFAGLYGAPLRVDSRDKFEDNPELAPPEYRHLVGHEAFRKALLRLRELSQKHNFEVLVFYRPLNLNIPETLAEVGLEGYNYQPYLLEVMKERGLKPRQYMESGLVLGKNDAHPSVWGHEVIAQALFEQLKESGILQRL